MHKILIVEDQAEVRKMLNMALKRPGHQLIEAADGLTALQMIKEHRPTVVLLDILMPGSLNGYQVCQWIKADPELRDTFVILASGLSAQSDFDEGQKAGADAFLVKPFRLSRLVEIVVNYQKLAGTFVLEVTP